MKTKLFDYIERDNFVYNLSGVTKLLCFLLLSFAVMLTYDIRSVILILVFSFVMLHISGIKLRQVKLMMYYTLIFLVLNFALTYLFAPQYGVEIYGTKHLLFTFNARYIVTQEQLLYQMTKFCKYAAVIPLGMLFLLTTNPSEFAASLNSIGVSYKLCYAFALTLRYFPDIITEYHEIALAQQSRGLDLSKKEKVTTRVSNTFHIMVPLIFSVLNRVEIISNAMDLRGFGKNKKRTWYARRPLKASDIVSVSVCTAILVGTLLMAAFVNFGRFWNPFVYGWL